MQKVVWIILGLHLLTGLFGAGALSYQSLQGVDPCPTVGISRACYMVFFAYLAMLVTSLRIKPGPSTAFFWIGWLVAFGFALTGSLSEFLQGDICPRTDSNIPMCYISLAFCAVIAGARIILRNMGLRASG